MEAGQFGGVMDIEQKARELRTDLHERWFDQKFTSEELDALILSFASECYAAGAEEKGREFKNFHRSLCERFSYSHDDADWRRDQVSLREHIAAQLAAKDAEIARLRDKCEQLETRTHAHCCACDLCLKWVVDPPMP
jgi:hypothetical protein